MSKRRKRLEMLVEDIKIVSYSRCAPYAVQLAHIRNLIEQYEEENPHE